MTSKQVANILRKAAALVRKGWCKGSPARDSLGLVVGPLDEDAVEFCAIGAIQRVCRALTADGAWEARRALREVIGMEIAPWNDGIARDAEQVARAFEEAARTTA